MIKLSSRKATTLSVIGWLALLALLGWPVLNLEFNNDIWLSEDHPVERSMDRVSKEFEPGETLLVILPLADNFFASTDLQEQVYQLEQALGALQPVTETQSPLSARTVIESPPEPQEDAEFEAPSVLEIGSYRYALGQGALRRADDLDADPTLATYAEAFSTGPYAGRLLSDDARLAAVQLRLDTRENQQARLEAIAQIRSLVPQYWPDQYWLVGAAAIKNELNLRISESMVRLLLLALFGVVLLLRVLLGTWPRALLIASCASGCTLVAMAWLPRLGTPLTAPGLILPVMVLTVALADSLHLLACWDRIRPTAASPRAAVLETWRTLWLPCLAASLTTAIGCGAFITSDIIVLSDFSWVAIVGVLSAYPLMVVPLLTALALQPDWFARRGPGRIDWLWTAPLAFVRSELEHRPVHALLLAGLPCLLLSAGLYRLHTESNFLAIFFDYDEEIREGFRLVDEKLGGSGSVNVILDSGEDGQFRTHRALERVVNLEQSLQVRHVNRVDSYALPLRMVHPVLSSRLDEEDTGSLPRSDEELEQEIFFLEFSRSENKRGVLEPYADFTYASTRLDLHTPDLLSADLADLIADLEQKLDAEVKEDDVTITGFGVFLHQLSTMILDTQLTSLAWTMALIAVLFLLQFKLLSAGLGLLVNLVPLAATAGTISWLGLPYDFGSILVIGITLGFAVDDTLHLLHRYAAQTGSTIERLQMAIKQAGPAVIEASLVLMFGLSLLLSSDLVLIDRFALFAIFGLFLSLVCTLILLPALFLRFNNK